MVCCRMIDQSCGKHEMHNVETMCRELIKELVAFPYSQICKHYAAIKIVDAMERHGIPMPPKDIVRAIVRADDDAVAAWGEPADGPGIYSVTLTAEEMDADVIVINPSARVSKPAE